MGVFLPVSSAHKKIKRSSQFPAVRFAMAMAGASRWGLKSKVPKTGVATAAGHASAL